MLSSEQGKSLTCAFEPPVSLAIPRSGAGKTTLLDVLAARIDYSGEYTLNGTPATSNLIRTRTAYVLQENLFFPFLTVREHMWFQAQLRLPSSMSSSDKKGAGRMPKRVHISEKAFCFAARVTDLIESMGLTGVSNSRIGFMSAQSGAR